MFGASIIPTAVEERRIRKVIDFGEREYPEPRILSDMQKITRFLGYICQDCIFPLRIFSAQILGVSHNGDFSRAPTFRHYVHESAYRL